MLSNALAPSGCVEHNAHQATRDDTGTRKCNEPTHVDPCNHAPVDGPPSTVTQTNTDGGTSNALRGRDGKSKLRGHDNSHCSTKLHGKTTGRRVKRDLVTQRAHDVVAVCPETNNDTSSTKGEDPERDGNLVADLSTAFELVL